MFVLELAVPWLIFAPRRGNLIGAWELILFQGLIAATGNYAFFNLLTVALCLWLLDDAAWPGWIRMRLGDHAPPDPNRRSHRWPRWFIMPVSALVATLSLAPMAGLAWMRPAPQPRLVDAGA
jgi:hypothetical protein